MWTSCVFKTLSNIYFRKKLCHRCSTGSKTRLCIILHLYSSTLFRDNNKPANIYLFKVNNRSSRNRCETTSKLTIKTPERRLRRSGVFIVNFEQVNVSWETDTKSMTSFACLYFLSLKNSN